MSELKTIRGKLCMYCFGEGGTKPAYLDGEYKCCTHCDGTGVENGNK